MKKICDFCVTKCDNPECDLEPRETMKGILQFNLDDPEDRNNYNLANNAINMRLAIEKIGNFIRDKQKYNQNDEEAQIYAQFQDEFHKIIDQYGVNPWDI